MVKQSKMADVTTGGLYMPADSIEKPSEGVVVLAGPGAPHPDTGKLMPNPCKAGDLVLLNEYVGEKVDYCNEKHSFVPASEVLGIFTSNEATVDGFKPLRDNILVELEEAATETTSGIALASEGNEDSNQGEVVAVGDGLLTSQGEVVPTGVSVGESVGLDVLSALSARSSTLIAIQRISDGFICIFVFSGLFGENRPRAESGLLLIPGRCDCWSACRPMLQQRQIFPSPQMEACRLLVEHPREHRFKHRGERPEHQSF